MSGSKKQENNMKTAALNEVKDKLSKYLRLAEKEEILITRHGKPAGVLIGLRVALRERVSLGIGVAIGGAIGFLAGLTILLFAWSRKLLAWIHKPPRKFDDYDRFGF